MSINRTVLDDILSKHRLLAIARVMARSPRYALNVEVLDIWLDRIALSAPMAVLEADLRRLEELKVCRLETVDHLLCATLTQYGNDIAEGRVWIDEIERPGPECRY